MTKLRTTHVGSLPRPQELLTMALRKQEPTRDEVRLHLRQILERQLDLGIDVVSNGELTRADYVSATVERIAGFAGVGTAPLPLDLEEVPELSRRFNGRNGLITLNPKAPVQLPACSEPLAYTGTSSLTAELDLLLSTYRLVKELRPGAEPELFFTAPSPGTVALFMENAHYPDDEAYLASVGAVMRQEYELIAGAGVQLQIDCPDLAMGRHTRSKHLSDEQFLERIAGNVRVLNEALAAIDPALVRVHVCWGNYPGTHHRDVGLREIFDTIMAVRARYVSLESSNHRHAHEWTLFEELTLPEEKVLLPGVIDTSSNTVEHPDLVAQRIINFAKILGSDRVIASTDCGFATTASAASVSGEVAWLKLASLVEGARRASERL